MNNKEAIDSFSGEYRYMSNFWVEEHGKTVEHFYQACKATNPDDYKTIINAPNPARAKRLGQKIEIREDWEQIKYEVMKSLVWVKFVSDHNLLQKLLATGNVELIEGNMWHDNFYGNCYCDRCKTIEGKNKLGKILMEVRDKYRILVPQKDEEKFDINSI